MTRNKVKLAFIVNDAARKASFNKRRKGLLKKVEELSVLCGIQACAIVYGPYEPQPDFWPSREGIENMVLKFRSMPELEHGKNKLTQEDFLNQRVSKAQEKLLKLRRANMENKMKLFMYNSLQEHQIMLENIPMDEFNVLSWLIDQNLKEIDERLEEDDNNIGQSQIISAPNPGQLQIAPPQLAATTRMDHAHTGMILNDALSLGQLQMAPPQLAAPTTRMGHGHTGMTLNDADIDQRQIISAPSPVQLQMAPLQLVAPPQLPVPTTRMDHGHTWMTLNDADIGQSQIIYAPSPGQLQMAPPHLAAPTTRMDHGHTGITLNDADIGTSQIISAPSPYQLQMALPQLAAPTTTSSNEDHGHTGMTLNDADIIQRQFDMDLMLNGNGDETIPFGHLRDANL